MKTLTACPTPLLPPLSCGQTVALSVDEEDGDSDLYYLWTVRVVESDTREDDATVDALLDAERGDKGQEVGRLGPTKARCISVYSL
jgi:hypothetical protein